MAKRGLRFQSGGTVPPIGVQGAHAFGPPWLASSYPSGAPPAGYTPFTSGWSPEAAGMGGAVGPSPGAPASAGGSGGQRLLLASNLDVPTGPIQMARRLFGADMPPVGMVPDVHPPIGPEPGVRFETLASEAPGVFGEVSPLGAVLSAADIANIALSDRPDAAKGMLAAQAILPAFGIPSPYLPVQMIDFASRLFGGGGLFAGNRPHAYVPPYESLSPAARARIDEASTLNTLQPYAESSGISVPALRSYASADTSLTPAEVVQIVQGMPFQDTLNPATVVQRVQESTPPLEPLPTWEELSGWQAPQAFQQGGMVPWVPGRPWRGDTVKSWLEPGEVVVPRELAPTVLQQFPSLARTPPGRFFQQGGMASGPRREESPVWAPGGGLRFRRGGSVPGVGTLAADILRDIGIRPVIGPGSLAMNGRR